ncbi:hypothetical protein OEZ85_000587 [Tetradesmus obliquus]|uniref:Pherophorin domain-containing protein n=1 Tax=Tetradesmus obliquus TaxID=3088 RepID=A0ABY8UL10_TETOB|nr:hypothetical protein OEZ85_000587 [Tetradesmus obliquus]
MQPGEGRLPSQDAAATAAATAADAGNTLTAIAAQPADHRRSLLQFDPGFPWPTADMRPVASQCNKTGNSTIELFYDYNWPANSSGPYCFRIWTNASISGGALGEITAPLNGQTDASASFVQLTALGFEVGKNCTNAVASASLTLSSGATQTITAGNTVFTNNAAWSTGRLNLTLTNPIRYDNVTNAVLCMTLRSPCANIFALCQAGGGTSCGTFVSVFAYRQKKSCCECFP